MNRIVRIISALLAAVIVFNANISQIFAAKYGPYDFPTDWCPEKNPPKFKLKKEKVPKAKPIVFDINYEEYPLNFTDVEMDYPNRKYIIWAVANGVIKNEKKAFNPDEEATLEFFCNTAYELRYKYHQAKDSDIMKWYNGLLKEGNYDYKTINPNIPEFRFLMSYPSLAGIFGMKNIRNQEAFWIGEKTPPLFWKGVNDYSYQVNYNTFYFNPKIKFTGYVALGFMGTLNQEAVVKGRFPDYMDGDQKQGYYWSFKSINFAIYHHPYLREMTKRDAKKITNGKKVPNITDAVADLTGGHLIGHLSLGVGTLLRLGYMGDYTEVPERKKITDKFIRQKYTKSDLLKLYYTLACISKEDGLDIRTTYDKNSICARLSRSKYGIKMGVFELYSKHK